MVVGHLKMPLSGIPITWVLEDNDGGVGLGERGGERSVGGSVRKWLSS